MIREIDTPFLLIDKKVLKNNIKDMAHFAASKRVKLRPHIKSHKMPYIAKMQIENGAKGITVAKLGEAEIMAEGGIEDIFIAYQIIGEQKIKRLISLCSKTKICVAVDSLVGASEISKVAQQANLTIDVMVEIDTGLNRCGLQPDDRAIEFVQELKKLPNLNFRGLFTHGGHAYGCSNNECVQKIGKFEGEAVVRLSKSLEAAGIKCSEVSVGSTPTAKICGGVEGVTELRPGNYVFNDAIQIGLGAASLSDCSLRVIARVISIPDRSRAVIDAGSKVLALDKGAHGNSIVEGHGMVISHPGAIITRLSEEHGIMDISKSTKDINIGDIVEIIPNHSCTVINLSSQCYILEDGKITRMDIAARGKYY